MSMKSEARRDAHEYARAQMYYGDGAGIRRRLIEATVDSKMDKSPEYERAFRQEFNNQDMAEHAEKARKERRRRDVSENVSKNAKNLATGNYQGVQTSILVLAAAGYFAHKTGFDKKLYAEGKKAYGRAKAWYRAWRNPNAPVYNITVVNDANKEA